MTETDRHEHESDDDARTVPDGGMTSGSRGQQSVDYLDEEVNLLNPSTSFMRDHLRLIWAGFVVWALLVFGPVTLTAIAPDVMTTTMPLLEFPLHYFLVALGAPTGALLLSVWYARKRDQLDEKYDIEHPTGGENE